MAFASYKSSPTTLFLLLCSFLSICTWGVHFPCFFGEYTYDDNAALIQNNVATLKDTVWNIFITDYWGMDIRNIHSHGSYRPLTTFTFSLSTYLGTFWLPYLLPSSYSSTSSTAIQVGNTTLVPETGPLVSTMHLITTIPPAWEYRMVSFLLHNLITLCVFTLNYHFSRRQLIPAFLGTLIFTIHPLLTEAVCSIASRADLLAALLNILTVYLAQRYIITVKESGNHRTTSTSKNSNKPSSSSSFSSTLIVFTIIAILSTFAKETGIMILPVCIVLAIFHYVASGTRTYWTTEQEEIILLNKRSTDNDKQTIYSIVQERNQVWGSLVRQRSWKVMVLSFFLTVGLLVFRIVIIQGGRVPYFTIQENISIGLKGLPWLLTVLYLLSWHLGLLIYPYPLNIEWNMFSLPPVLSIYDVRNIWSFGIIGSLLIVGLGTFIYTLLWIYGQENMIIDTKKHNSNKDSTNKGGSSSPSNVLDLPVSLQLPLPWLRLFALGGILITFFPASSLLFPVGFTIAERIMYTPAIFFSFFITVTLCLLGNFPTIDHYIPSSSAVGTETVVASANGNPAQSSSSSSSSSSSIPPPSTPSSLTVRRSKSLLNNNLLVTIVLLLAFVGSYFTYQRCYVWVTEESLWSSVLETNPASAKAHYMLGVLRHNGVTPMEIALQNYDNSLTSFENSIQISQHPNMGVWDTAYPDPVINVVAINLNHSSSKPFSDQHLHRIVKVLHRLLRPIQYPTLPNATVELHDKYSGATIEQRVRKVLVKEIHDKVKRLCREQRTTDTVEATVTYKGTDYVMYEDKDAVDTFTTVSSTSSACDRIPSSTTLEQFTVSELSRYSFELSRNVTKSYPEGYLTMKQVLHYLQEGCVKVPWKSEYVPETWNVDTSCYFIGTIYNLPESETRLLDRLVKIGVAHLQLATYNGLYEGGYDRWINNDIAHELFKALLVLSRSSPGTSDQDSLYIHLADALLDRGGWNQALPWYDLIIRLMLKQSVGIAQKVQYSTNANERVEGTYLQRLYDSYHNIVLSLRDLLRWKYIPSPLFPSSVATKEQGTEFGPTGSDNVRNNVRKRYYSSTYLTAFSNASVTVKIPSVLVRNLYSAVRIRTNPVTQRIDTPYPMHVPTERRKLRAPSETNDHAASSNPETSFSSASFGSSIANISGKFCLNIPHSSGIHKNSHVPTFAQIQDYLVATQILLHETNHTKFGDAPFVDRSGLHFECDLPRQKNTACGSILHSSIRSAWSSVAPYIEAYNRGLFRNMVQPVCTCQRQTSINYQICTSADYALPTEQVFRTPQSNIMPYFHNIQRMTNLSCQPATCARRYPDVEATHAAEYMYNAQDIEHNLDLTDFTTLYAGTTTLPTAFYYAQRAQMLTFHWVHGKSTNAHEAFIAGTEAISALFTICGCSGIPEE